MQLSIQPDHLIGDHEPLALSARIELQRQIAAAKEREEITKAHYAEFDRLQFLSLEGVDKKGRRIIRIVGRSFPGSAPRTLVSDFSADFGDENVDVEAIKEKLTGYIQQKLSCALDDSKIAGFVVVYLHSAENNNLGLLTLRWLYDTLSEQTKEKLQTIYFVHPGIQSRLLLGTLGRLFLSGSFHSKVNYVDRIEFLWEHIDCNELDIPEFVWKNEDYLECRPYMDKNLISCF